MRPMIVTLGLLTFLSVDAYAKDKKDKKDKATTTTTETTTVETTATAPAAPAGTTTPAATTTETTVTTTTTTTTTDCTTLAGDAKVECEKAAAAAVDATKTGKSMQKSEDGKLEAVEDE